MICKLAFLILLFITSDCFAAVAVSTDAIETDPTNAEIHIACLRHKNGDGSYQNGWGGCTAFEATYAAFLTAQQSVDSAAEISRNARVLAKIPPP